MPTGRRGPGSRKPRPIRASSRRRLPSADPAADRTHEARSPRALDPVEADGDPVDGTWTPGGDRTAADAAAPARSGRSVLLAAVAFAVVLALLAYFVGGMIRGSGVGASTAQSETSALDWITVFSGDDLESLSTPEGGGSRRRPRSGGRDAVRVSGPATGEGEVLMAIGSGVVGEIAGSNVRIEVTAGSPDGTPRAFSVRCLFGGTSLCERQSFSTTMTEEAFIFDVPVRPMRARRFDRDRAWRRRHHPTTSTSSRCAFAASADPLFKRTR